MRTSKLGDIVPFGLSRRDDGYLIRLPALVWYRNGYDAAWDHRVTGWWAFNILVRFGGRGFKARCGWTVLREDRREAWPFDGARG